MTLDAFLAATGRQKDDFVRFSDLEALDTMKDAPETTAEQRKQYTRPRAPDAQAPSETPASTPEQDDRLEQLEAAIARLEAAQAASEAAQAAQAAAVQAALAP